ncbi:hypothetical protein [Flavobacterium bizetiae]|uniref:hypothetical protein n=1 Tax=Flavobacterium bizetiae TaxID=2704140 RepID=UPI0037582CAA
MDKEYQYILDIKTRIKDADWSFERKKIILEAVVELRKRGHNDLTIKKLFQLEVIKEQDNSHMVNNNVRYQELLDEVLAENK